MILGSESSHLTRVSSHFHIVPASSLPEGVSTCRKNQLARQRHYTIILAKLRKSSPLPKLQYSMFTTRKTPTGH